MPTPYRYRLAVAVIVIALLSMTAPTPTPAEAAGNGLEIQTGAMLGNGYHPHWLYLRSGTAAWQPAYAGSAVEGRLLNFRAANAIFDDADRDDDDPQANTSAFISNLDDYREHGILAVTVSLQGGNPGYEGADASAFSPDGALNTDWMERAAQVIEAANAQEQIVILTYFYQRQDQVLEDADAIRQAVRNATDWLIAHNYRNVIIEIANEYNSGKYDHAIITNNTTSNGIGELITIAKSRFDGLGWRLPVSASSADINFKDGVQATADLALVHGNLTADWNGADTFAKMDKLVAEHAVPIVMNEDRNGSEPGGELLARDSHALDDALAAGGSWGLMWQKYNQYYPFGWSLGDPSKLTTNDGYFHAILDVFQHRAFGTNPPPPPPPPSGDGDVEVLYSHASNRSGAVPLHGATVKGDIYPFATPGSNVISVEFLLDGAYVRNENSAPFDFSGGSRSTARAWDTTDATDGRHTISALLRLTTGATTVASATFTVANGATPDPPPGDTSPPNISDVHVTNVSPNEATVNWTTDEPATSRVELTANTGCEVETISDSTLLASHALQLTELNESTTYSYRVRSSDAQGNSADSATYSFTTPSSGGPLSIVGFVGVCSGQVLGGKVFIEALVSGDDIVKVEFVLSGPANKTHVERNAPFFFFGNSNRGPYGWVSTRYPNGSYTLKAIAVNSDRETATAIISFTIDNP